MDLTITGTRHKVDLPDDMPRLCEPPSATLRVEAESVTIWTATQIPAVVRDAAARITRLDPSRIILHVLPAGGSFGRRRDHDYWCRRSRSPPACRARRSRPPGAGKRP